MDYRKATVFTALGIALLAIIAVVVYFTVFYTTEDEYVPEDECVQYGGELEYYAYIENHHYEPITELDAPNIADDANENTVNLEDLQPHITEWTFPADFDALHLNDIISVAQFNNHDEDFARVVFEVIPHFATANLPSLAGFDTDSSSLVLSQTRLEGNTTQTIVGVGPIILRDGGSTINLNNRLVIYNGELLVDIAELLDIGDITFIDRGIITIYLPYNFYGNIMANSGFRMENSVINGNVTAESTNQSIRIINSHILGDVDLSNSSGSIRIYDSHIDGELSAQATSGSIRLYNADTSDVNLDSASGSVRIYESRINGTLFAQVASGSIHLYNADTNMGDAELSTRSGAIIIDGQRQ